MRNSPFSILLILLLTLGVSMSLVVERATAHTHDFGKSHHHHPLTDDGGTKHDSHHHDSSNDDHPGSNCSFNQYIPKSLDSLRSSIRNSGEASGFIWSFVNKFLPLYEKPVTARPVFETNVRPLLMRIALLAIAPNAPPFIVN